MLKVKNKKTIKNLSNSSFKANRLRNIFAIIAIILTTVLFTGLFTIVSSLMASMEESTMRQVGTSMHGGFKYITEEQYDIIKTHKSIKEISYSVVMAFAENSELAKRPTEIRYISDEIYAKYGYSLPTSGRLPENDDEIATDTIVLDMLGVPAELGQQVTLEYSINDTKKKETFTLVGFWDGDIINGASMAWLNKGFIEKELESYIPDQDNTIGTIMANVNFTNSKNIEEKLLKVLKDCDLENEEIQLGENWAYIGNNGDIEITSIIGIALIVVMILLCGYLIISNVFYISVAKDIRYYGMLKTVGTTGRQIKFLIRRQALLLCIIGVPLGLIAGYFVGSGLCPIIMSTLNTNVVKVDVNPLIFIVSAIFAIVTVILSIKKPSRIASKVSPIEAIRSSDSSHTKAKTKKSGKINIFSMAWSNIARNKKKCIFVTISLSLSLIILNSAYSMADSFDIDLYLKDLIDSDFAIGDVSNFNVHAQYFNQNTLSDEFLSNLSSMNGIEKINRIYFSEYICDTDPRLQDVLPSIKEYLDMNNTYYEQLEAQVTIQDQQIQHIYGLDDDALDKLVVFEGEIDIDKLKSGNYVVVNAFDNEGIVTIYNIGDKVMTQSSDGTLKEYEVMAIASIPYNISIKHFHTIDLEFFLPAEIFLSDIEYKQPMLITLDVLDSNVLQFENYISDYCNNIDYNMQYESKMTLIAEYENTQRMFKVVGTVVSLLIAFIGIMNFINTTISSIISRKREIAMLRSIGMTSKQCSIMLISEGFIYTMLTAVFSLSVGSVLGSLCLSSIQQGSYFARNFTILPSLLCLPILAFISVIIPYISQHIINKSSIVERLREETA